jgi:hypothetical protein
MEAAFFLFGGQRTEFESRALGTGSWQPLDPKQPEPAGAGWVQGTTTA